MNPLRDARLQQALAHAPDAQLTPDPRTRQHILQQAAAAVAPPAVSHRPWWRVLWPEPGASRMPWNAAFATVLLASFITVLWQGQPVPEAQPDEAARSRAAMPASTEPQKAAAPAAPPSPPEASAEQQSAAAGAPPAAADAPAPRAQRARPPVTNQPEPPQSAARPSAQIQGPAAAPSTRAPEPESAPAAASPAPRAFPASPAAEMAAVAPPPPAPAPATQSTPAAPMAERALAKSAPQESRAADASALPRRAGAAAAAAGGRAEATGDTPALAGWTSLRIETPADGRALAFSRSQAATLAALLRGLAPTAGPDAPLAQAPQLRIHFLRGDERLGVFEWTPANELRWTQFAPGQTGRWTAQTEASVLQGLQSELRRLGVAVP